MDRCCSGGFTFVELNARWVRQHRLQGKYAIGLRTLQNASVMLYYRFDAFQTDAMLPRRPDFRQAVRTKGKLS